MRLLRFMLMFTFFPYIVLAQNAKEIVKKADDKFRGQHSSFAEVETQVIRPGWSREMSMKTWSMGDEYGMVLITAPARDEGTAFLKRGNEVWNWVPRIQRTIKLPPSMMMQSWMGTDFTNDDLVKQASIVKDYDHKILKSTTINGRPCWKIQLTPKEDAAVVWGKLYLWITKDQYLELKTEFYDEDGQLVNILKAGEIKKLGGRTLPSRMEMIPVDKEGHKTVMKYKRLKFNIEIENDFFTARKMKNLR